MGYSIERRDDIYYVAVYDRLDIDDAMNLEDEINSKLDEGGNYFILNFRKAEYISSNGIRIMIYLLNKLKESDGIMAVSELSEAVDKILQLVDIKKMFTITDSDDEAFAYINEKL